MKFDFELVGKIGSMALIRRQDNDIDYNIFSSLGSQLRPGYIWVSSGATEIGRLDYMKRNNGSELTGTDDEIKTDYASQGQSILMENYRRFIPPEYSVRQVLLEHQHFNDEVKRAHILNLLLRARDQGAIPIINYNDAVSTRENLNYEISTLRKNSDHVVECVDNDETAAVISCLVKAKTLLIMTSAYGIYRDPSDPATLINEISGSTTDEVLQNIRLAQQNCIGASRSGANGARAKLEYMIEPVKMGTKVIIGSAKYKISELLDGSVPRTVIGIR